MPADPPNGPSFSLLWLRTRGLRNFIALPGNHDVNVVDRASPARMDLPTSPMKRLRQIRTMSALECCKARGSILWTGVVG